MPYFHCRIGRGAAARFFGGLEDADHLAREVAAAGENVEGAERPGRVAVMATGVAAARLAALPGIVGVVRHRQRVDVAAQGHGLARTVPLDDGDHGARNGRGVDFVDAPGAKLLNDLSAGARRFEGEFGVLVQVVTEFDEFVEDFEGFREADFRTEGTDHSVTPHVVRARCGRGSFQFTPGKLSASSGVSRRTFAIGQKDAPPAKKNRPIEERVGRRDEFLAQGFPAVTDAKLRGEDGVPPRPFPFRRRLRA